MPSTKKFSQLPDNARHDPVRARRIDEPRNGPPRRSCPTVSPNSERPWASPRPSWQYWSGSRNPPSLSSSTARSACHSGEEGTRHTRSSRTYRRGRRRSPARHHTHCTARAGRPLPARAGQAPRRLPTPHRRHRAVPERHHRRTRPVRQRPRRPPGGFRHQRPATHPSARPIPEPPDQPTPFTQRQASRPNGVCRLMIPTHAPVARATGA
jgi:hypothetical protein